MAVIELFVDQFLAIDQGTPETFPFGQSVLQVLTLTDSVKNYWSHHSATQLVEFGQTVAIRTSVYNVTVLQYLPFYDQGGKGPELQVLTQFFWVGQSAKVVEVEQLAQAVTFTDAVLVDRVRGAVNNFEMGDAASCNLTRSVEVFHTLFIGSGGTGSIFREESYSIQLPTLTGPNAPEC